MKFNLVKLNWFGVIEREKDRDIAKMSEREQETESVRERERESARVHEKPTERNKRKK